eukprot:1159995-Pelagomonas_calceolata.AAC.2
MAGSSCCFKVPESTFIPDAAYLWECALPDRQQSLFESKGRKVRGQDHSVPAVSTMCCDVPLKNNKT